MTHRPPFPLLAAAALTLVSGLAQADTGKLLLTGGVFAACYALSMLPALARLLPPRLSDGLALLTGDMRASDFLPALWIALALSAVQSALCVAGIQRKQL